MGPIRFPMIAVVMIMATCNAGQPGNPEGSVEGTSTTAMPSVPFDHTHAAWTALLERHVAWNDDATATAVDYGGFANDGGALDEYLTTLGDVPRGQYDGWTWDERQAFLINAYNAATVQLILTRYPNLESINELGGFLSTPWKKTFVALLGQEHSLDDIEHGLLRGAPEYVDPRIHFAVNCASIGCPALRPEAFVADRLDQQLHDQTQRFLRDTTRNRLVGDSTLELSKIFDWYGEDFDGVGGVAAFVATYPDAIGASVEQVAAIRAGDVEIRFLEYDWALNSSAVDG